MRLIYTDGFGVHERKEVRQVIFSNMVVAFKIIGEEMRDLGMDYAYGSSLKYESTIANQDDIGLDESFPIECLEAMKGLWEDPSVQSTMRRGNEFALHRHGRNYRPAVKRSKMRSTRAIRSFTLPRLARSRKSWPIWLILGHPSQYDVLRLTYFWKAST